MNDEIKEQLGPAWCIVANIIRERPYGPGGQKRRLGTKQFAPGAKVYIVDFFWGMGGESLTIVGRHWRSHRYITLLIRSAWLVNWRVELVYSPSVIRVLQQHPYTYWPHPQERVATDPQWMGSPEAKIKAEEIIRNLQQWHPTAGRTQPYITRAPNDQKRQEQQDDT
jgi:hypothetical protein